MTNSQLYLAIGVPIVFNFCLIFALYKVSKDYADARFKDLTKYLDTRFTSIDNRLEFLINHLIKHGERIAALEAHTNIRGQ